MVALLSMTLGAIKPLFTAGSTNGGLSAYIRHLRGLTRPEGIPEHWECVCTCWREWIFKNNELSAASPLLHRS